MIAVAPCRQDDAEVSEIYKPWVPVLLEFLHTHHVYQHAENCITAPCHIGKSKLIDIMPCRAKLTAGAMKNGLDLATSSLMLQPDETYLGC